MAYPKKATDSSVVEAYNSTGSVHRAAAQLGMNHASVHERLLKLGAMKSANLFNEADEERLSRDYLIYRDAGKLVDLAKSLGRTKSFICRKARTMGLTDQSARRLTIGKWKYMKEDAARLLMDDFKSTLATLGQYCKMKGFSEVCFWRTMTKFFSDEWEHVIESKAPKMLPYRRGRAFEYSVRNFLKRKGYFVLRSPASRSPLDLVAIKPGTVLFIQCKISGALPTGEWNSLYDLAISTGAVPVLAARAHQRLISLHQITGRKNGKKRRQPITPLSV